MKLTIDIDYKQHVGVASIADDIARLTSFTIIKKHSDPDDQTFGVAPLGDVSKIDWRNDFYEASADLLLTAVNAAILMDTDATDGGDGE